MNAKDWQTCQMPDQMLDHLFDYPDSRKLRLFACACCRQLEHLITVQECWDALLIAEDYADGLVGLEQLNEGWLLAQQAKPVFRDANWCAAWVAAPEVIQAIAKTSLQVANLLAESAAAEVRDKARASDCSGAPDEIRQNAWSDYEQEIQKKMDGILARQADLIRCIVGNPFAPIYFETDWLKWKNGIVPKMAWDIYESREFGDMSMIADTLEEAGCNLPNVLNHCRDEPFHARGCHIIDAILQQAS